MQMQKEITKFGDGQASVGLLRRSGQQDVHSGQPVEALFAGSLPGGQLTFFAVRPRGATAG
jgi:hypothetical protein